MKKLVLTALLLVSYNACAVTLDDIQQRFAAQQVVRADFQQERQISGMAHPLHSRGKVLIAKSKGLWWQQQHPFPMTLILDDSHMVQVMGSQAPQVITADSNPQMFQFNHLLRALFQADRKVLDENFSSRFSDLGKGQWQLVLTPTTSPLDKLFSTITLKGEKYLNAIELNDTQGDFTEITFSNQRPEPRKLTPEEQQRFAF
ncbi:outer membrane lipoprotein carrier protein LolA [Enterobacteriaceae bacterium H11S18]|uniref:LolA family protein n=1 Tax=Dryocola clanedunensis TaxID=2925396 RepID=UPI0022F001C7|nr:outer membrane lipoprotein carrier protein LolA [Dryocola clanedunensis]MCT4712812.1 outer membrane lipoprotein carrier protein LolA [Dryocola clanedunensis]